MLNVRHKKAPNAISGRPAGLCRGKLRVPGKVCQREPRAGNPPPGGPLPLLGWPAQIKPRRNARAHPSLFPRTQPRTCRSAWTVEFRFPNPQIDPMAERVLQPVVSFSRSFAEADARQRAFWHSRTPEERLWHLEYLRELNYGPAPPSARLPRIPRVSQRRWS